MTLLSAEERAVASEIRALIYANPFLEKVGVDRRTVGAKVDLKLLGEP